MNSPDEIIKTIRSSPRIPAPSHTVFKILEMTKDENCPARKVGELIQSDAGLTAQLLQQANSALYGFKSPTSSPQEACVRLGMKRVRAAVINKHIVNGLGKARPEGFDANRYWQGTLAVSVAAKELCQQLMPAKSEDAGTAGLLCDIGIGMLAFGVPMEYTPVLVQQANTGDPLHRVERRVLQISHADVAYKILQDWKLDAHILTAVQNHHYDQWEMAAEKPETFSRIVAAAVTLSEIALDGTDMDLVSSLFAQVDALSKNADAIVNKMMEGMVTRIQQLSAAIPGVPGSCRATGRCRR